MESKMEDLMNGIKAVHLQYQDHQMYTRHQSMPSTNSNAELYASIRRARSTAAKRPSNLSITANTRRDKAAAATAENLSQDADTPDTVPTPDVAPTTDLSQSSTVSSQASSCTYPSPPMLRLSPSSSSSPPTRQRSMSATAASLRFRPAKPSLFSVQTATSCGNIEEIPTTTIHELPESPTFVSTTSLLSTSNCSLHNNATTTTTNNYRRSLSVSSPPPTSSATLSRSPRLTSTPNVYHSSSSSGSDKRDYYHTLPNMLRRNSHSDNNVMNTTIPEGEVDSSSITDSLSQLSTCTDEGSPKNGGSTIVVRRSSLTGQIEHYRKPRLMKKSSSSSSSSSSSQALQAKDQKQREAVQSRTLPSRGKDVEFRVLNRGVRKSSKNRTSKIILSSIETTV